MYTPQKLIRFISLTFSGSRRYIKKKEEEIIYLIIVQMIDANIYLKWSTKK